MSTLGFLYPKGGISMAKKETRNAKGAGMIRQRSDGSWEARYTAGRDPGTGKQIQKSVYGKTQKEVRKKLTEKLSQLDGGIYTEPSKITVSAWLDVWLAEYTGNIKERTHILYKGHINTHFKPALGAVKLSALTAPHIQKFYNNLQRENGLSPKTIKNLHGILHKALQQAVEVGYLRFNPSDACKLPRAEKADIKPLEEQQIADFMKVVQGHALEALYIVDLFTGMRQGEIMGMTWDCVDFKNGTLHIYRQLQLIKGRYEFVTLKNDRPRKITPAPYVMKVLANRRKKQLEARLRAGELWEDSNLVFTNETGRHLARQTVYKQFKNLVAEIGMPSARFHDLRHSYAVAALQSGDNVKTVQQNLGHHTAAFTLDVYGHVTESMRKESADRMEAFINGVSNL